MPPSPESQYQIPATEHGLFHEQLKAEQNTLSQEKTGELDILFQEATDNIIENVIDNSEYNRDSAEKEIHPLSRHLRNVHGQINALRERKIARESVISQTDNGGILRGLVRILFVKEVANTVQERTIENAISIETLVHQESIAGGTIFGEIDGATVKFFCDEKGEWFYCEERSRKDGKIDYTVFHYIAYDEVVLAIKNRPGEKLEHVHLSLDCQESRNLLAATSMYLDIQRRDLYTEAVGDVIDIDQYCENDKNQLGTDRKAA